MLNLNTKTNVTFWFIFCDDNPKYWLFVASKSRSLEFFLRSIGPVRWLSR